MSRRSVPMRRSRLGPVTTKLNILNPMCIRPPCTKAEEKMRNHCEGCAQTMCGLMQKLPGARAALKALRNRVS